MTENKDKQLESFEGDVHQDFIHFAQYWALTVAIFGGIGNFFTILVISYQFYLNKNRKTIKCFLGQESQKSLKKNDDNKSSKKRSNNSISSVFVVNFRKSDIKSHSQLQDLNKVYITIQPDSIILLHLSICDFFYCVVTLPITYYTYNIVEKNQNNDISSSFCVFAAYQRYVTAFSEWLTLALLTFERCIDIKRVKCQRWFTVKKAIISIFSIWIFSCLVHLQGLCTVSNKQNK